MSGVPAGRSWTDQATTAAYAAVHSKIHSRSRAILAVAALGFLSQSMPGRAQPVGTASQSQGAPASQAQAGAVTPGTGEIRAYDWTGFYLGGHFGYYRGWLNNELFGAAAPGSVYWFGSLYGGFQAGYNIMLPSRLVLGIEADISFPNFLEDGVAATRATPQSTITDQVDDLGTLRARVGYALDRWLIYGTGGFAWSQARFIETAGSTGYQNQVQDVRTGWAAGIRRRGRLCAQLDRARGISLRASRRRHGNLSL